MAPSPFTQRCISATTLNDIIYVVGGLLDDIYKYTPSLDIWSKMTSLPMKLVSYHTGTLTLTLRCITDRLCSKAAQVAVALTAVLEK